MDTNGKGAQKTETPTGDQTSLGQQPFFLHDWVVDPRVGDVRHQDKVTRLEPKVMEVLVYLADRPGKVIPRTELEETVWADVVVSYETLTSAIQRLRKAFDDDAHNPRFIETLPKRGYRLVAPVRPSNGTEDTGRAGTTPIQPDPSPHDKRHSLLLGMAILAVLALGLGTYWLTGSPPFSGNHTGTPPPPRIQADRPVIAVLPFTNMSEDKEQEYFSDGLTEDLITDLSKVSGLRVISRNATSGFKQNLQETRDIAEKLGASHVIKGSVRKSENTVRITVQLVDATNDYHLWADRYDRELKDIFAIQDEVIGNIITMLSIKLTTEEETRIARKGTTNIEAHDLYLRARERESFFDKESYLEAEDLYKQAIKMDPDFADAYARLSIIYIINAQFGWVADSVGIYNISRRYAEKSIALNPSLPVAHYAMGRILARPHYAEYDRAIEEFEKSIALSPNYADSHANLALVSIFSGNAGQALKHLEKAILINPLPPFWYYMTKGMAHYLSGNYDLALKNLETATERSPTVFVPRYWMAATLAQIGREEDAQWEVQELRGMGYDTTMSVVIEHLPIIHPPYREKLIDGLRKAGFE